MINKGMMHGSQKYSVKQKTDDRNMGISLYTYREYYIAMVIYHSRAPGDKITNYDGFSHNTIITNSVIDSRNVILSYVNRRCSILILIMRLFQPIVYKYHTACSLGKQYTCVTELLLK